MNARDTATQGTREASRSITPRIGSHGQAGKTVFVGQPGLLICLSDAPDRPHPSLADGELTRANPLHGLAGVLPLERPDQWAALFTDKDLVTLRHRTKQRMSENTLRARASDRLDL